MANGKTVCMVVAAAVMLSACGGPVVTLKNPQSGQMASCKGGVMNTGMASQRVEDDLITQCVDGYARQGYEVIAASR